MAEASNGSPVAEQETSPGAAGPPSSSLSIALTEDMSIHLSPRDSPKGGGLSPKATKPVSKTTAGTRGGKAQSSKTVKLTSGSKKSFRKEKEQSKLSPSSDEPKEKCDMCDEYKVMQTRCLNCHASMCGSCTEHHKKMKISCDHETQSWDKFVPSAGQMIKYQIHSNKPNCKTHRDEKLQLYCRQCLIPLCIACKLTKHEGHKTRDLNEEISEQRDNLPFKLSQIRASFLPLLKQQIKELEEQNKQVAINVKGTVESVEKRSRIMKEEIDKTSNRLLESLKQKEKTETTKLEQRKQTLAGYVRNATTALTSGERIAQHGNDFEVMELYQNIIRLSKQIQELTKKRAPRTRLTFSDGSMTSAQLQSMFGIYMENGPKLETLASPRAKQSKQKVIRGIPTLQVVPEVHARLLKTFICKMVAGNKVSAIAPINDSEAWICFGWTTTEIYLYNKDGYRRNRIVFKQPVDDIAIDGDGNLLVSTFTGSVVRIVDKKLQVRDFFQCPLRCRGLDVSAAGEIIVCGVDMCTAIPSPNKCTIFKFTARGNKTGHLDGDRTKRIPIHPYRVAENIDGSIAVSDWISDKEGRVVVFSHDGKVRMVYYGLNDVKGNFLPYGICTDKFGHIIVGDIANQEVHLLDIKGHFLKVLITKEELDNERPYSVAVDHMGTLWIGNERAQIKIFRYLLHQSHIV
ncbi:uncharacterized protein LOC132748726 isoform X2 [Ruditapes philippinarum]|nr:uncharacterized protein LOC132748726 isoform X2 [Ruditapes philippinarum]